MPIHRMQLEGGVFFAKQVGYVDSVDISMWSNALETSTRRSDKPVIALVDMTEADRICPTLLRALTATMRNGNLLGVVFVANDMFASRNDRIFGKIMGLAGVHIFGSMDMARSFVDSAMHPPFGYAIASQFMQAPAFLN